jgi:hypothetical protein
MFTIQFMIVVCYVIARFFVIFCDFLYVCLLLS